jgi:transposase
MGADLDRVELRRFRSFRALPSYARLHAEPDWAALVRELKRPGVNLLVLWDEYRAIHPEGYAYSRFCQLFREFERRLSPTMHQQHVAGHKAFVDYSGKRVPIIDPASGEVRTAEIFIAVLGASNLTYAEGKQGRRVDP